MTNKELKEKYKKLFNVINKIVNDWDPIGKLPSATDDKYEFEVAKIVPLLNKVVSATLLFLGLLK